jgi:putative lumazine-binding protein
METRATHGDSDEAAVVAAALDYFEGWFEADPARMDRALHPELAKRSLSQSDPDSPELRHLTKERMVELTAAGGGKGEIPDGGLRIDVEVVDLYGNTASVVIRSAVYREYLHLVRTDEGWKIVNALWHFT